MAREESADTPRPLRYGYTTGACATAVSLTAARLLLGLAPIPVCTITLPRGQHVEFSILYSRQRSENGMTVAEAATVKDAGDDPDVTHGATVFAIVKLLPEYGVKFRAAAGVGTVTRSGLAIQVGEPAINPVPRQMMLNALNELAQQNKYCGGFEVAIGVIDGERLAQKTMNPRLGIVGGLSILGTTGIVRPFSCSAYIASIHQGIDVAYANGYTHIAASTGATSETMIRNHYHLPDMALIEMGDFAGAVLKHLRKVPIQKLSMAGGIGKISKLAAGHLDLHSRHSTIDFGFLAQEAQQLGASASIVSAILNANTAAHAVTICQQQGINLGQRICEHAREVAQKVCRRQLDLEVWAVDQQGKVVGFAGHAS